MSNLNASPMGNTQPLSLAFRAKAEIERRRREGVSSAGQRFARYRDDPAAYAREVLNIEWWTRQIDIANSIRENRRTVVYAGHSVGKTMSMGGITQWHFDCWDPSITLTTAPSWSSIHDLLWGEIKSQRPPGAGGRLLDLRLDGGPMHYLAGHNAESGSSFQGRHEARVLIVLDEAMGVPPYIWEATNAMLTSPDCRVIALGNPTETSGEYYEIRENPDWNVITISCLDHPNIAAELRGEPAPYPKAVSLIWIEEMLRKHCTPTSSPTADAFEFPPTSGQWYEPDDVFRSRVLGLFPRQSAHAIWSEAWLIKARQGGLTWKPRAMPEIGVDVARYGEDRTTIYARRGPVVTHRESYSKQGTMETAGCVVRLADKVAADCRRDGFPVNPRHIPIKVDDTGLGCLTPDTDVLTPDGWRRAGELAAGEKVISRAANGHMISAPLDRVQRRGNVEILKSGPYEFSATHLVPYKTRREHPWQLLDWSEVLKRKRVWLDTDFVCRGEYPELPNRGNLMPHTPAKPESRVGTVVYLSVKSPSRLLVCRFADGCPFWTHNGGVTDRLDELEYSVQGIDFGEKAVDPEEFFNRGSEMWFTAAYRARDMRLDLSRLPEDVYRRLSAELRARRYKIQSDKTLRAESKDDIKKRVGRSPDDADALALAFAGTTSWEMLDVSGKTEVAEVAKAERTKTQNPYVRQVQDMAPRLFPDADPDATCGNCVEFKLSGGKGRCGLRYLQVDATDPGCEFFDMREMDEGDEDGEDGDEEDDD